VLLMHYQSSYSAARGSLLMAWRFFLGWRDWLASDLCQPVYELWLSEEVAAGRISARGFFADPVLRSAWCSAQWVGDGPGSIDPAKEVTAASDRVALGISTLQAESILHDGVDWETKHAQAMREAKARKAAGLTVPGAEPPPPVVAKPDPIAEMRAAEAHSMQLSEREAAVELSRVQAKALLRPAAPPEVTVTMAPITIQPAAVHFAAGATSVHLPDGLVHLEATVDAPVTVHTPPTQVVLQPAPTVSTRQIVKYKENGDIEEVINTPLP
jgi:hypothetical protein